MTPAAAQTGYATVNGLSMYYEVHGDGQPLVLLHGGFGMTGMFGEVLPQLAAGRRVIAVDLQGTAAPPTSTGRSAWRPWATT